MSGRDGGTGEGLYRDGWTCAGCGHEGNGPDNVEWTEHTKVCPATSDADPASTSASEVEEWKYAIDSGWLVQVVNKHTCGTGPDGYYGAHEPGCGTIPIADISDLLAAREAAAETRGRAEALLPIRRYAEALAITYRARGIDDRAPLDLLILLDRADSLAAPRGDGEGK